MIDNEDDRMKFEAKETTRTSMAMTAHRNRVKAQRDRVTAQRNRAQHEHQEKQKREDATMNYTNKYNLCNVL